MNSTSEYIKYLKKAKSEVEAEIRRLEQKKSVLEDHRNEISSLLEKIGIEEPKLRLQEDRVLFRVGQPSSKQDKPVDAIKKIMSAEPNRVWIPPDLRTKLIEMREAGELDSKATNMLHIVHSSLKSLKKSRWVEVIPDKDQPAYKKRKDDNQSSLLEEQKNDEQH